jgi:hypothetical protein
MKKTFSVLMVVSFFLMLLAGCSDEAKNPSVFSETTTISTEKINLEVGITIGNHSYLPINVYANPDKYARAILQLLDAFEKEHPELEITSWDIERNQKAANASEYIWGVWVDHRPKK